MVRLDRADRDETVAAPLQGFAYRELELTGLVAAAREAGEVVALDEETDAELSAEAGQFLDGGGEGGEANSRKLVGQHESDLITRRQKAPEDTGHPRFLLDSRSLGVSMGSTIFMLLVIFAAFGAFCFNVGTNRAYRLTLKALLKGQIAFIESKLAWLGDNRGSLSAAEFTKACLSYSTIAELVLGWYRYFARLRDDRELKELKSRIKTGLEAYLALCEEISRDKRYELDIG
jgi:hypothetical protein